MALVNQIVMIFVHWILASYHSLMLAESLAHPVPPTGQTYCQRWQHNRMMFRWNGPVHLPTLTSESMKFQGIGFTWTKKALVSYRPLLTGSWWIHTLPRWTIPRRIQGSKDTICTMIPLLKAWLNSMATEITEQVLKDSVSPWYLVKVVEDWMWNILITFMQIYWLQMHLVHGSVGRH